MAHRHLHPDAARLRRLTAPGRILLAALVLLGAVRVQAADGPRIVTLAPHLAELVYLAGAGDRLVATVAYSDFPDAAAELPRIGDAFRFDLEQLVALQPDLVLAWDSGNPDAALDAMDRLGLPVWRTEIRDVPSIARLLEAGFVPIGRTNMTEFAYSGVGINPHYGTPLNPWDRATGRIPGGSSSGAAVSVTDGMAAAGGRLYVSLTDGSLLCLGDRD